MGIVDFAPRFGNGASVHGGAILLQVKDDISF
jgi:hypothetical protein